MSHEIRPGGTLESKPPIYRRFSRFKFDLVPEGGTTENMLHQWQTYSFRSTLIAFSARKPAIRPHADVISPAPRHAGTPILQRFHAHTPTHFSPLPPHANTIPPRHSTTPLLHYSTTPLLHYSITPLLHHSITPTLQHSHAPIPPPRAPIDQCISKMHIHMHEDDDQPG